MSHRIVYGLLAIRFSSEQLKTLCDDFQFREDHYLMLELGGDNNVTAYHPVSRREVGSRCWILGAMGCATDIVRDACHSAAYCEGGGMRFYGERDTTPEAYIRRIRTELKRAVSVEDAQKLGFTASITLTSDPASSRGKVWADEAALLSQIVPRVDAGERQRWTFNPLNALEHAVQVLKHKGIDEREVWELGEIKGPTFDFDQVIKRYRQLTDVATQAA